VGPLLASWRFDQTGSYLSYYAIAGTLVVIASVLIAFLPSPADAREDALLP
jgi:hypothetical protein